MAYVSIITHVLVHDHLVIEFAHVWAPQLVNVCSVYLPDSAPPHVVNVPAAYIANSVAPLVVDEVCHLSLLVGATIVQTTGAATVDGSAGERDVNEPC